MTQLASILVDTASELDHMACDSHLDYGTYELILEWLAESLQAIGTRDLSALKTVLSHARTSVKRSSGLFFEAIWKAFLALEIPVSIAAGIRDLRRLASTTLVFALPTGAQRIRRH